MTLRYDNNMRSKNIDSFPSSLGCGFLIKQISDEIARQANNDLRKSHLTLTQLRYLGYLYEHGEDLVPLHELSIYLAVSQPTIAGITKRLKKKGLIETSHDRKDSRVKNLLLTSAGRKLYEDAEEHRQTTENRLLASLNSTERKQMKHLLECIYNNLKKD